MGRSLIAAQSKAGRNDGVRLQRRVGRGLVCFLGLLVACRASAADVRVMGLDGSEREGTLISADAKEIVVRVSGADQTLAGTDVVRVDFTNPKNPVAEPLELGLVDGSRYRGTKLVGTEKGWEFADSSGGVLSLGPGMIRSLLVRKLTDAMAQSWRETLQEVAESDALILVRPENTVDRVNGLITEVKDGKVVFDLDGQVVEVPFEKLLGMLWFRKAQDRVKPTIEIGLTDGGVVYAETFRMQGERLEYQSVLGMSSSLPAVRISSLNYAHANLKWLYEVASLEIKKDKRLDWRTANSAVERALAPRFVSSQRNDSGASAADFDLVFSSPGSFTFRVPEGLSRFQTRIERSDGGDRRSELTVEVWQDDTRIAAKKLSPQDESVELEVPLVSGKRVRLSVVCDTRLMIGSWVTWKQPRLSR